MSYESAKWITLSKKYGVFSGGYVDNCANTDLEPHRSPYLRNARIDGSSIIIRPGHNLFATLTTGSYPKGIGSYLRADHANDVLVVRHNQDTNKKLATITAGGTITAIDTSTNITSNNRMRFINIGDKIYCMNGVDTIGKLSGTTYSLLTDIPVGFAPSFGVMFNSSMFVAGLPGYKPAYLKSGPNNFSISILAPIADGSFRITIDGVQRDITGITVPQVTTGVLTDGQKANIAAQVQTKIRALTSKNEKVEYNTTDGRFYIYCDSTTSSSSITVMSGTGSGTDLSGPMYFDCTAYGVITPSELNSNLVYKSVGDKVEDFVNTGSDKFTFQEQITGLSSTTQGLFYFTKNTVSVTGIGDIQDTAGTVSYITRVMNAKEGAVNHDSIVEVGAEVFYVTPNNNINKLMRGQNINGYEEVELSQRSNRGISNIMQSLDPDQTNCFGYFLPKENLIKWFFKSQGATFNDICIIYDTIKDCFLVDSNKYFFDGCVFNSKYYTVSNIEPKVYLDEYSQTDEDTPIPFRYYTKEYFIDDPTFKKLLWESRALVEINELAELEQQIWVNGEQKDSKIIDKTNMTSVAKSGGIGTQEVGTYIIGENGELDSNELEEITILRTKGNLNLKLKKVQWRYINDSLAGRVKLKSLAPKIEGLPPETTELTA